MPRTVGSEITIDASGIPNTTGGELSFVWEQQHLPDRYAGVEYITGYPVDMVFIQKDILLFQPSYPGNYRFHLTISGRNYEETLDIDVSVTLPDIPFEIRGIAYGMWHYTEDLNYLSPGFATRARESGANLIMLNPTWYAGSATANTMSPCPLEPFNSEVCRGTITDESLIKMVRDAHNRGLQVMIKPILNIAGPDRPEWPDIHPTSWDEWFRNWTDVCLLYARIAQHENVTYLPLGNQLRTTVDQVSHWRNLIKEVRQVYSGKLTYGDNSFSYGDWGQFKAWDDLDYIGVHLWAKTTGDYGIPETTNPTVEEMTAGIESRITEFLDPLVEKYNKPVIFLEFGTNNYDGANIDHFWWNPERIIDNKEQAEYYEAGLRVFASRSYTSGVIIWAYTWKPELDPGMIDMSPAFKPAEKVLRYWFGVAE